jgi:Flp pilus assembly pilin Flp
LTLDESGQVFVEYAVVLAMVCVGMIGLLVAAGPPLVTLSHTQQDWVTLPIP